MTLKFDSKQKPFAFAGKSTKRARACLLLGCFGESYVHAMQQACMNPVHSELRPNEGCCTQLCEHDEVQATA